MGKGVNGKHTAAFRRKQRPASSWWRTYLCTQAADWQTVELERREARPPAAAYLGAARC
jgi:hypothetical protein